MLGPCVRCTDQALCSAPHIMLECLLGLALHALQMTSEQLPTCDGLSACGKFKTSQLAG